MRPLTYSISFVGVSLFFVALNYTTNLPYFENFRASPVFLISATFFFWWVKMLFYVTRVSLGPLILTQLLSLGLNFGLKNLFSSDPKLFGFVSDILYYLSTAFSVISIIFILAFIVKIWRLNKNSQAN